MNKKSEQITQLWIRIRNSFAHWINCEDVEIQFPLGPTILGKSFVSPKCETETAFQFLLL